MTDTNIISFKAKSGKHYKKLSNLIKFQPEHKVKACGVIKSNGFWRLANA